MLSEQILVRLMMFSALSHFYSLNSSFAQRLLFFITFAHFSSRLHFRRCVTKSLSKFCAIFCKKFLFKTFVRFQKKPNVTTTTKRFSKLHIYALVAQTNPFYLSVHFRAVGFCESDSDLIHFYWRRLNRMLIKTKFWWT